MVRANGPDDASAFARQAAADKSLIQPRSLKSSLPGAMVLLTRCGNLTASVRHFPSQYLEPIRPKENISVPNERWCSERAVRVGFGSPLRHRLMDTRVGSLLY